MHLNMHNPEFNADPDKYLRDASTYRFRRETESGVSSLADRLTLLALESVANAPPYRNVMTRIIEGLGDVVYRWPGLRYIDQSFSIDSTIDIVLHGVRLYSFLEAYIFASLLQRLEGCNVATAEVNANELRLRLEAVTDSARKSVSPVVVARSVYADVYEYLGAMADGDDDYVFLSTHPYSVSAMIWKAILQLDSTKVGNQWRWIDIDNETRYIYGCADTYFGGFKPPSAAPVELLRDANVVGAGLDIALKEYIESQVLHHGAAVPVSNARNDEVFKYLHRDEEAIVSSRIDIPVSFPSYMLRVPQCVARPSTSTEVDIDMQSDSDDDDEMELVASIQSWVDADCDDDTLYTGTPETHYKAELA